MGIKRFLVLSCLFLIGLEGRWAPDYMIIGAQKSGTTAIFDFINQHPKAVNKVAEVHYFDLNYDKGIQWYWQQFPSKPSAFHILGDKSPYYMFHPLVPKRVHKEYPNMKFIVVLRNPVDRAYSHYWMKVHQGEEKRTFEEAIEQEPALLAGKEEKFYQNPNYQSKVYKSYSYLSRGYYAEQLVRWFTYFSKDQFLIVDARDLRNNPQDTMNKIFRFIGTYEYDLDLSAKDKKTKYPPMKAETRALLSHHFQSYNEDLEAMIGRKFNWE